MPCISMFYGLLVYMYNNGSEHNPPHFHVKYGGQIAVFDLEGNLTEGSLPPAKQKLVAAWAEFHKEELKANWELCIEKQKLFRIKPLE